LLQKFKKEKSVNSDHAYHFISLIITASLTLKYKTPAYVNARVFLPYL
jgi:hypothetical protein